MVRKSREERGKSSKEDSLNYWTIPVVSVLAIAAGAYYGGKKVYDFYKSRRESSNTKQNNGEDGLSSKL